MSSWWLMFSMVQVASRCSMSERTGSCNRLRSKRHLSAWIHTVNMATQMQTLRTVYEPGVWEGQLTETAWLEWLF